MLTSCHAWQPSKQARPEAAWRLEQDDEALPPPPPLVHAKIKDSSSVGGGRSAGARSNRGNSLGTSVTKPPPGHAKGKVKAEGGGDEEGGGSGGGE